MHAWTQSGKPLRLVEREADSDDEDPKALACYGVYLPNSLDEEENATEKEIETETEDQNRRLSRICCCGS